MAAVSCAVAKTFNSVGATNQTERAARADELFLAGDCAAQSDFFADRFVARVEEVGAVGSLTFCAVTNPCRTCQRTRSALPNRRRAHPLLSPSRGASARAPRGRGKK